MYIARKKKINETEIIIGIDTVKIDQVATAKKIKPLIESTKEFKAQKTRFEKIQGLNQSNASLDRQVKQISNRAATRTGKSSSEVANSDLTESELTQVNKFKTLRQNNVDEKIKIEEALPEINEKLKTKSKKIMDENAVYFDVTNENETVIDDETAKDYKLKLKNLGKKQLLLFDGSIVDDLRGNIYYALIDGIWDKKVISSLSDGINLDTGIYCLAEDLTEEEKSEIIEQKETTRIKSLSDENKESEKQIILDSLATKAAAMRSKLEIQGASDALVQAQEWYNEKAAEIETKYA